MLNAQFIRERRGKLGLTQQQAAERAGIGGRAEWNRIEMGRHTRVSGETLVKLARALNCGIGKLVIVAPLVVNNVAKRQAKTRR